MAVAADPVPGHAADDNAPRRDWWRRGVSATLRFASHHGWRAKEDRCSLYWGGCDWDGRSSIDVGNEKIPPAVVESLLEELRVAIAASNVRVAKLPDLHSVRRCRDFPYDSLALVIDVDFGEFILPVSIWRHFLLQHADYTATHIRADLMKLILTTDAARDDVAALELQLRNALEEQSNLASVVPLWLRMAPSPCDRSVSTPINAVHEMTVLMLDEDLRPVMSDDLVGTVKRIHQYLSFHGKIQRRRAAIRSKLDEAGSAGFITEVALGLIDARGLDPREILTSLRASRKAGSHDGILHRTKTTLERLTLVEGIVDATIDFDGGDYTPGKLTLYGDFPKTLAMSAKGHPLTAFVDHPAFRAAGITVTQARALSGRLRLYHPVRYMPMEDAERARHASSE